jgi:hypothetical protein
MSTGFQSAKKSISLAGINLTAFNEPISNSKFFGVGNHPVKIDNIEVKDYGYGDNIVVTYINNEGATIKQFITLAFTDRETQQKSLSKGYILFTRVFTKDVGLRSEFFLQEALADTSKFNALKGLKANITVSPGKKGYDIVSEPTSGGHIVVDVADKGKLIDTIFTTITEANNAAKDLGLKRAFNEVTSVKANDEEVLENEKSLRAALEASETPQAAATLRQNSML